MPKKKIYTRKKVRKHKNNNKVNTTPSTNMTHYPIYHTKTNRVMKNKINIAIFVFSLLLLVLSLIYLKPPLVYITITLAFVIIVVNIVYTSLKTYYTIKKYEAMFPNFIHNVVGGVKSGMPLPKAVINAASVDYKELTPLVKELAYKIEWGISFKNALIIFAKKTHSEMIKKVVSSVIEAEKSGANVEEVLSAVTNSLIKLKELKEKRRANVYNRIVQSYIIYLVFIIIMIIVQKVLVPTMLDIQASQNSIIKVSLGTLIRDVRINTTNISALISSLFHYFMTLKGVILAIVLIEGLFMGLVLGKLAEGSIKAGVKHSLILMALGFIIITMFQ